MSLLERFNTGDVRALSLIHATRVLIIVTLAPLILTLGFGATLDNPIGEPIAELPTGDRRERRRTGEPTFAEEVRAVVRRELRDGFRGGLSSYPHPRLMPDFWEYPTVSMGLGPIMAIYQARFMRYLHDRGLQNAGDRKVWAYMGDGEMDEPESMGAITMPVREGLGLFEQLGGRPALSQDGSTRGLIDYLCRKD